jgi:hypothetical protein
MRTGVALGLLSTTGLLANLTGCVAASPEGTFIDCAEYPDGNVSTTVDLHEGDGFFIGDGESNKLVDARYIATVSFVEDIDGKAEFKINESEFMLYDDLGEDPTEVFSNSDGHTITAAALPTDDSLKKAPAKFTYYCTPPG